MPPHSAAIRSLLNTPIPSVLWHYTSLRGLKGIVESKKIWATDIRFLNDSEEYKHAVDLLLEEAGMISDLEFRSLVDEVITQGFSKGALSIKNVPVFVTSFSASKDLLSQWRGYTEINRGVSLGFDLRAIRPNQGAEQLISFAPCIYGEDQKRALIRSALEPLIEQALRTREKINTTAATEFQSYSHLPSDEQDRRVQDALEAKESTFHDEIWDATRRAIFDLVPVMPLLKHPSFEEEQEWRLVLHVDPKKLAKTDDKKIRVGAASLIPYIDIDLPRNPKNNLPTLTELVMGPTPVMERAISAAKALLEWNGFSSLEPQSSATSLRSW